MSVYDSQRAQNSDICSLDHINNFLHNTFGQSVQVKDFFPEFIKAVGTLQKNVGLDVLDEKKRYRL